jgi:hypothetical protein
VLTRLRRACFSCTDGGTDDPHGWLFDACPDCPACRGQQRGCCCRDGTWSSFPFWWEALLSQPRFADLLRCRWDELRAGEFSDAALDQRIDGMRAQLSEPQARNFAQWPVLDRHVWPNPAVSGSWESEVDRMRDWIMQRTSWLDASIPQTSGDCATILG